MKIWLEGRDSRPSRENWLEGRESRPSTKIWLEGRDSCPSRENWLEGRESRPSTKNRLEGPDSRPSREIWLEVLKFRKHPNKSRCLKKFGIGTPYIIHKALLSILDSLFYLKNKLKKIS